MANRCGRPTTGFCFFDKAKLFFEVVGEVLIYIMNNESLKEHILKKVQLSDEELELFVSYFKEKKVKKKQFIILPGSIAKYRSYVVKGAFRAYVIDDEGSEHTIQF